MPRTLQCILRGFAVPLIAASHSLSLHAATTFELLPGSTITLSNGPTESLSGVFTLGGQGPPVTIEGQEFPSADVTGVWFQSPSTSFTRSVASNLFLAVDVPVQGGHEVVLAGYADAVGLPVETVSLNGSGYPVYSPTIGQYLSFPDFRIVDPVSGLQLSAMSFAAIQVPEPSAVALSSMGIAATLLFRLKPVQQESHLHGAA